MCLLSFPGVAPRTVRPLAVTLGNGVFLACVPKFHAQTYSVTDLGALPGKSHTYAYDINDSGQVTVYCENGGVSPRGYVWTNGSLTDVGVLGSNTRSYSFGINSGQTTGYRLHCGTSRHGIKNRAANPFEQTTNRLLPTICH